MSSPSSLAIRRRNGTRAAPVPRPAPDLKIRVKRRGSLIMLSGEPVSRAAATAHRREFIDRLFSIPMVSTARFDLAKGEVRLFLDAEGVTAPEAIDVLAAAMHARELARLPLPHEELALNGVAEHGLEIHRAEKGLTFWRIDARGPGHFRISHPLLVHEAIAERVLDGLAGLADVIRQEASFLFSGSIEVWCRPHRIDRGILCEALDAAIADYRTILANDLRPLPIRRALINANLVLAPIADFVFAPLGFINALFVYLLNLEHVGGAIRGFRERRCNLELLYLCIGAATLYSFSFFGAAVMYWMLDFWPRATLRIRRESERQFLAQYRRRPWRIWVENDGALLESSLPEAPLGQVLALREGDTIPGDGVILEGSATVSEGWITGVPGLSDKQLGDPVFASSRVGRGEIRVQLRTMGQETVAAQLAARYEQALRQPSSNEDAREFAEAMVLPALICGAAALGTGGIHMAKPVIRPDYFTGPAIAEEVSRMLAVVQSAEAGLLISDPAALDRIAEADCWIFDDSVPWRPFESESESFAALLHSLGVPYVCYLGSQSGAETSRRAADLGISVFHSHHGANDKKAFIAQRQFLGQGVVYFGDCARETAAAEQADVAVTVINPGELIAPRAPIALLSADLRRCAALHSLSQARPQSVKSALGAALIPNLAAVAGAVYFHLPVMASVILTNLGTFATYWRWRQTLRLGVTTPV